LVNSIQLIEHDIHHAKTFGLDDHSLSPPFLPGRHSHWERFRCEKNLPFVVTYFDADVAASWAIS
jgi:hypothetical protein